MVLNLYTFPYIMPLDIMSDDPGAPRQTFLKIVGHVRRDRRISGSLSRVSSTWTWSLTWNKKFQSLFASNHNLQETCQVKYYLSRCTATILTSYCRPGKYWLSWVTHLGWYAKIYIYCGQNDLSFCQSWVCCCFFDLQLYCVNLDLNLL